jgi:hypothetical protein
LTLAVRASLTASAKVLWPQPLLAGAVLLGGVLRVVDQHVGVAGELDERLVDVVRRVLGVGGEDDALAALVDAERGRLLRVRQRDVADRSPRRCARPRSAGGA